MKEIEMIFGAPGCGKTTYLIDLLKDILKENPPNRVAFVSFTRKGSYEGRDRAIEKFNYTKQNFPFFRTIHSLAFRDLGVSRYDMISQRHYKEFSDAMGMKFVGYYTEDFVNNDDKYLFYCSLERNNLKASNYLLNSLHVQKVQNVKNNYKRYKKEMGIKDFDDLLEEFIVKDQPLPVDIAIIDEAQDLTSLQWEFCRIAFRDCKKIYVAGDDDQAIYEWSGADIDYFLELTKSSKVTILDHSYRLKSNILNISKNITNRIKHRVPKDFTPSEEGGLVKFYNRVEDVQISSEESYYYLARNNYFLWDFREHLMKNGLVFNNKGKFSVDRGVYNAIRSYEKHRKETPNSPIPDRVYPFLRKDKKEGQVWYEAFDLEIDKCNYYRDLFKNKTDINKCSIDVSTVHGVKGGEADNVVMKLDVTRMVQQNMSMGDKQLEAELRCLYVGITRAKKNLHIIHSSSKFGYDQIFKEGV